MAFYYYACSGHKFGLDGVRRAAALIRALENEGIEMELLVSDFRAGLAARELGVEGAVNIETILDVNAVAQRGDIVILDTPEDPKCLQQYAEEFGRLFYVTEACGVDSQHGEILLMPVCKEEARCIETPLVDHIYGDPLPKEERTLFVWGDADYDKELLSHREFFEELEMELMLGHYFFVKYEEDLAQIFDRLHEPETYGDILRSSSRVVTASAQTALEASASGAEVIYMKSKEASACLLEQLASYDIKIIDKFNKQKYLDALKVCQSDQKAVKKIDIVSKNIIRRFNL